MEVKPATIEDAEAVLALQRLAYQSEAAIYIDFTIPPLTETLDDIRARFLDRQFLKAVEGGQIVGSVRAYQDGMTCHLERLVVHPDYRHRGIGTALLKQIETLFPTAQRFELFTGHKSESNIRLYERVGYRALRQEQANEKVILIFMEKLIHQMQNEQSEPKWLMWSRQLMAIAQNGLTYVENHFDRERYEQVRQIAAEMMAEQSDTDCRKVVDLFSGEVGYATPKVDVRGVVFREDQILLVKERADGLWTLPGGWADVNESPAEAVVREVVEESGYHTQAKKLLAVWDRAKHPHTPPFPYHIYKIFILCKLIGGDAAASHETEEVGFFPEGGLPNLSISRVTPGQIVRLFEHHRHPDLQTDFD